MAFAAITSVAMAQSPAPSPFTVGVNLINGLNGVTSITDKTLGASIEVGYQGILGGTQIPYRASLTYVRFPGSDTMKVRHFLQDDPFVAVVKQHSGVDTSLSDIQVAGDIYLPLPIPRLKLITGMSLNKWHANNPWLTLGRDSSQPPSSQDLHSNGPEIKFGFRAGLSYDLTDRITGVLRYQWSALGSTYAVDERSTPSVLQVDQSVNPSWIDLGITYRF